MATKLLPLLPSYSRLLLLLLLLPSDFLRQQNWLSWRCGCGGGCGCGRANFDNYTVLLEELFPISATKGAFLALRWWWWWSKCARFVALLEMFSPLSGVYSRRADTQINLWLLAGTQPHPYKTILRIGFSCFLWRKRHSRTCWHGLVAAAAGGLAAAIAAIL